MEKTLLGSWFEIGQKYSSSKNLLINVSLDIDRHYSQPKRYYHNKLHIESMLNMIDEYSGLIHNYDKLVFAAIFHDVIYDPFKKNNEEMSAEYARVQLKKLGVPDELVFKVEKLIVKTKNHIDATNENDTDDQIFLDIDLMVLASNEENYLDYIENIRQEYRLVLWPIYKMRRLKFCKALLAKEFIFQYPAFRNIYEDKARKNLKNEIELLEGGKYPSILFKSPFAYRLTRNNSDDSYAIEGFNKCEAFFVLLIPALLLIIPLLKHIAFVFPISLVFLFLLIGFRVNFRLEKNLIIITKSFWKIPYYKYVFTFDDIKIYSDECSFLNGNKTELSFYWNTIFDSDCFFNISGPGIEDCAGLKRDLQNVVGYLKKVYY